MESHTIKMRTIALMCTRNESDRYLRESLKWNRPLVDDFYLFDDYSTDDTVDVAMAYRATVGMRGIDQPSFNDSEGLFRQLAWNRMEEALRPEDGDWIVCLDADEFLIDGDLSFLQDVDADAIRLKVHECFGEKNGKYQIREDGFWGDIWGIRIGKYRRDLQYPPVVLGGGSLPPLLTKNTITANSTSILHLGYLRESDRKSKYDRYTKKSGRHATSHVKSIIQKPKLVDWGGPMPELTLDDQGFDGIYGHSNGSPQRTEF